MTEVARFRDQRRRVYTEVGLGPLGQPVPPLRQLQLAPHRVEPRLAPNAIVLTRCHDDSITQIRGRSGPAGSFDQPHTLTLDSRGRVFVGDRSNGRVQIFEPDGTFVAEWRQFGRPSGMFIDEDDVLYVTDSTSNARNNPGFDRGIYIGSAVDGTVHAYIPDPDLDRQDELRISGASGITADREGNVYAADVGPQRIRKYVKR